MPLTFRFGTAPFSRYMLMSCVAAAALLPANAMAQILSGYPSAYGIVGTTNGGVTTFGQVAQYAAGTDNSFFSYAGLNRFGDYSATVVDPDPSNPNRFWTIQEVAENVPVESTFGMIRLKEGGGPRSPSSRSVLTIHSTSSNGSAESSAEAPAWAWKEARSPVILFHRTPCSPSAPPRLWRWSTAST